MKMHLETELACEISYKNCEMEKVQISEEAEMLYYELIRALEEEEAVSKIVSRVRCSFKQQCFVLNRNIYYVPTVIIASLRNLQLIEPIVKSSIGMIVHTENKAKYK